MLYSTILQEPHEGAGRARDFGLQETVGVTSCSAQLYTREAVGSKSNSKNTHKYIQMLLSSTKLRFIMMVNMSQFFKRTVLSNFTFQRIDISSCELEYYNRK